HRARAPLPTRRSSDLIALACFALLLRARGTTMSQAYRIAFASVLTAATALMFLVGWASTETWLFTTVATIAILLVARMLTARARSEEHTSELQSRENL